LWSRAREAIQDSQVRDGAYVRDRYEGGKRARYSVIEARIGGELAGFVALRHARTDPDPRLAGLSVAVLSDILFHPASRDVPLALLRATEQTATALGADALLCSTSHPALLAALTRRAYLRIPSTLQFLVRLDGGRAPGSMTDWWLMRADGNSDEGL